MWFKIFITVVITVVALIHWDNAEQTEEREVECLNLAFILISFVYGYFLWANNAIRIDIVVALFLPSLCLPTVGELFQRKSLLVVSLILLAPFGSFLFFPAALTVVSVIATGTIIFEFLRLIYPFLYILVVLIAQDMRSRTKCWLIH